MCSIWRLHHGLPPVVYPYARFYTRMVISHQLYTYAFKQLSRLFYRTNDVDTLGPTMVKTVILFNSRVIHSTQLDASVADNVSFSMEIARSFSVKKTILPNTTI